MGSSHGQFVKYPRTPHLFGSRGTDDDRHLNAAESAAFLRDPSLIVEEKLDGTNVGIHFAKHGGMVLQCRGHEITEGMHPQYDLFKQWTRAKSTVLEERLQDRYILFGEWLFATHSVHYRCLSHYFFEFDIYDKQTGEFVDLAGRLKLLDGSGLKTVPVIHRGAIEKGGLEPLIGPSAFDSVFDNPITYATDNLMEGLYLRTEASGAVTGRAKYVRTAFVERVNQSEHWQHQRMVPNRLAEGADIWA